MQGQNNVIRNAQIGLPDDRLINSESIRIYNQSDKNFIIDNSTVVLNLVLTQEITNGFFAIGVVSESNTHTTIQNTQINITTIPITFPFVNGSIAALSIHENSGVTLRNVGLRAIIGSVSTIGGKQDDLGNANGIFISKGSTLNASDTYIAVSGAGSSTIGIIQDSEAVNSVVRFSGGSINVFSPGSSNTLATGKAAIDTGEGSTFIFSPGLSNGLFVGTRCNANGYSVPC